MRSLNEHASTQRYAVSKKRSKKRKSDAVFKVWIFCDIRSKSKIKNLDYRRSTFRATECSFECITKLIDDLEIDEFNDDIIEVDDIKQWQLIITNSTHNHEFILQSAYSIYCRNVMIEEVLKEIEKSVKQSIKTSTILRELRMNHDEKNLIFKARDIYNERDVLRLEELELLTSTQILIKALSDDEQWYMQIKIDAEQKIQYLFYTSNCMQKILLENAELLIMNCIYKINRYKMPLLIIIEIINLNIFFNVNFCFIKSECMTDYIWALKVVKSLYRKFNLISSEIILIDGDKTISSAIYQIFGLSIKHLLCIWHIEQNIVENCIKFFEIKKNI